MPSYDPNNPTNRKMMQIAPHNGFFDYYLRQACDKVCSPLSENNVDLAKP